MTDCDMADYDIVVHGPARIGVADDFGTWVDPSGGCVRIRGVDLREVAHRASTVRRAEPAVDVLVDIDVVIDESAAGARERLRASGLVPSGDTLVYIGTPAGLAGLVADIHALGITDGAVLRPLLPEVAEVIRRQVLPILQTMSAHRGVGTETRPA